jgi:DNA-binding XRE family transcriptional regulator
MARITVTTLLPSYRAIAKSSFDDYVPISNLEGISALPRKPSLSRHLRDARIKRRLSVAEVAEQVGVTQSSIYFWATDHCRPRVANLNALCKELKLPVRATREIAAG